MDLLTALAEAEGTSGHEDRVRDVVRPRLEGLCARVETDPLGNLMGIRPADGPCLMLAAHMDEIGLMVTHVDDRGFVKVIPVGGWDARTLVGQRVRIHGCEDVEGVVGLPPVHLLDAKDKAKALEVTDLAIDLGLPAERARELVRAGDTATRIRALRPLGDLVTGKSLDDRVGVFVMLEALREAGASGAEVVATATVQEEVGLRGARVATARIRPDIALAIDTCPANDGPGAPSGGPSTRLGQGTAIRVMDASAICSPAMVELLTAIAVEGGIPHQFHVANRGGTDTGSLQLSADGSIAGCVSIPTRYVHSSVEACHPDDIEASIRLVAGFIERAAELVPPAGA